MDIPVGLKKLGFSEKEISVYQHLLKKPETTAFHIAKAISLPRTSVYDILNTLKNKGLITSWKKNNVMYFGIESPNVLARKEEERKFVIADILPQMLSILKHKDNNPEVRTYTGKEGVKIVLEEMLDDFKNQKITQFYTYSHAKLFEYLPKYFRYWVKERERLHVVSYVIMPESSKTALVDTYRPNNFRKVRLISEDIPFEGWFQVYGDKVIAITIDETEAHTIVMESPIFARMFKRFFLFTWNSLPEYISEN